MRGFVCKVRLPIMIGKVVESTQSVKVFKLNNNKKNLRKLFASRRDIVNTVMNI
jgi:hypothetical protein